MKKIYLLGSERSGSNLLRTLLGNHSNISAPIAPHFCDVFVNYAGNYKSGNNFNVELLLNDMEKYSNHLFNEWNISLDVTEIKNKYKTSSFINFVDVLYSEKALSDRKGAYFSKDNNNHKYALGILKDLSDVKFIYLYRDVRDQVASWMRSPVHLHTPFKAANQWAAEQRAILHLNNFYGVEMCFVRYEDLVDNVEVEMKKVLEFIGLPAEDACFVPRKDNEDVKKNPLWSNINKPVIKNNYGKFGDVLSAEDILMIETLCKNELKKLGYQLSTHANWVRGNKYLFEYKQSVTEKRSRRKNRERVNKEMKIFKDKADFIQTLFSKFKK